MQDGAATRVQCIYPASAALNSGREWPSQFSGFAARLNLWTEMRRRRFEVAPRRGGAPITRDVVMGWFGEHCANIENA